jgi:hypothetical protein
MHSPAELVTGSEPKEGMVEPPVVPPGRPTGGLVAKRPAVRLDGCWLPGTYMLLLGAGACGGEEEDDQGLVKDGGGLWYCSRFMADPNRCCGESRVKVMMRQG